MVKHKWPSLKQLLDRGWFYHVGQRKAIGVLSGGIRDRIDKMHSKIFFISKVHISGKYFDFINWNILDKEIRFIPLSSKLQVVKFSSILFGTDIMMKIMGLINLNPLTFLYRINRDGTPCIRIKSSRHELHLLIRLQ